MSLLQLAVIGLLGPLVGRATAATPRISDVNAHIDPATGQVRGAFRVVVDVEPGEIELRVWVLAGKLEHTPSAMDEQSARWIYPRRPDLGGAWLEHLHVNGVPVEAVLIPHAPGDDREPDAAGVDLRVPIPPGSLRVVLTGHFAVDVPERFGRLGRVGARFSMLAPWYPLVVTGRDGQGWAVESSSFRKSGETPANRWCHQSRTSSTRHARSSSTVPRSHSNPDHIPDPGCRG